MPEEKPKNKRKQEPKTDERIVLLFGLFFLLLSLFLLLAMVSHLFTWSRDQSLSWQNIFTPTEVEAGNLLGPVGASLASALITHGFGLGAFLFPLLLFMYGLQILRIRFTHWAKRQLLILVGIILSSVLLGYLFRGTWGILGYGLGGKFGYFVSGWLIAFMSYVGAGLVLLFFSVMYLVWLRPSLSNSFMKLIQFTGRKAGGQTKNATKDTLPPEIENSNTNIPSDIEIESKAPQNVKNEDSESISELQDAESELEQTDIASEEGLPFDIVYTAGEDTETTSNSLVSSTNIELEVQQSQPQETDIRHFTVDEPYDPTLDLSRYQMPPLTLLDEHDGDRLDIDKEELAANKARIEQTLGEFGIAIEKIRATVGPTVTLYEILPAPGVRVSKIESLEKDLALRLEALGVRIFIRRGAIGIEVPNQNPTVVSMLSILRSKTFQEHSGSIPLALGKTISNEPFVVDLEKMPHLLVAGATGQGKSVGLNAIIASILFKKHPAQVKLVMVDPKKVEFSLYSKIEKHFLAKLPSEEDAIITDSEKVIYTLTSLCVEMDLRLSRLKDAQVRNITEYNEKFISRHLNPEHGHSYMPRIVVIVDEFADLMMTSSNDIVPPIMRLAQLGRAAGIHLVIATQRPTTDILTGKIKANIPARIAFRVTSGIDSRTILDAPGADRLIGRGDMLIKTDGVNLERVQCAFLSTDEVARITQYISEQQSYASAWYLPEAPPTDNSKGSAVLGGGELDPLFEEVKEYVIAEGVCSITAIQRKFTLGFPRAARIVDQLEGAGVVSAKRGTKEREVLM